MNSIYGVASYVMRNLLQVFVFVAILLLASAATQTVFYVSPDNLTNTSCPFQPCATLSQYLLDNNGSLPVVSNVEYHFLPGEHHLPTNMTLQYLHNFTMTGDSNLKVSSTVLFIDLQEYAEISNSINVTISNVVFKTYDKEYGIFERTVCNVVLRNCLSCKLMNVTFLNYGFCGVNLDGTSLLKNIFMDLAFYCYKGIYLYYEDYPQIDHHDECIVVIDTITMYGKARCNNDDIYLFLQPAIYILLSNYSMTVMISSSYFQNMSQAIIYIDSELYTSHYAISIKNCNFEDNRFPYSEYIASSLIDITLSHFNAALTLSNCSFYRNQRSSIVSVSVKEFDHFKYKFPINTSCIFASNITVIHLAYYDNTGKLFSLHGSKLTPCKNSISIEQIHMLWNRNFEDQIDIYIQDFTVYINGYFLILYNVGKTIIMSVQSSYISFNGDVSITHNVADNIMIFQYSDVVFKGTVRISNNRASIMRMYSCNVTFNGSVDIYDNKDQCNHIIYFQFCNILFSKSIYFTSNWCEQIIILKSPRELAYIKILEYSNIVFTHNHYKTLIAIDTDPNYNHPYLFCLFQYVTLQNTSTKSQNTSHYTIIINDSFQYNCKLSLLHFTSHCQWIPSATFYGKSSVIINQQIIQMNYKLQHTAIFLCSNFSIDTLGPVYPGQMLQVELCMPCSDNNSVLYAETHNTLLPESACEIAHQTELVNVITNNSKIVNYTIVSEVNESCELFLTVSPFLYYIYEVFDVQLLPCPIGFTLQNGVCDCDPLLPTGIDTCYIDQSAIRRPANTWISYTQSGTSKYLISDCPMDYCLPFSSNVNLLHPDTQCQFKRIGILCSQCQHHLSMIFGSSRCMKCTNVHILITIIIIVAGIVLVVLLYLLNLTVTKAIINGMMLYANIISINNSVFLINNQSFKPLQIFISCINLDLGIETCFYNGMDGYVKVWLQLFFPIYIIFIAFSIIIASRYSSRILRLTYSRSLPVLATLFLLSYTSVLRTVLTVLISYSTITHVPSGHQELVWSVDASVPLFGLKFTILFITCLVLFLILLFFNIILLFTRCLSQYKLINYFKPILDAFQGPYKDRYYYWIAVYIMLRSLFFALYALSMKPRLLLGAMILITFTSIFGYCHPNKYKLINFQELLILINLTIMHAVSYYSNDNVFGIVINLMISLAFIQFCIIVIYHFLTYTCHCNIENILRALKIQLLKYRRKENQLFNIALLNIPERTYNYNEYQDGLISEDFAANS